MGQITLFEKDNCRYCAQVLGIIERFRASVLEELKGGGELDIVLIDCGKEAAYAAFCIRTTGTFTVPHVFFNEEYMGDATHFLGMDSTCRAGYNVLRNKLLDLAKRPKPEPSFPPSPDASMIKVTDCLAFSSQPTTSQLGALGSFGIGSVCNILRPDSPAYYPDEERIILSSNLVYVGFPIYTMTVSNVRMALDKILALEGTVLVHDDCGTRAGLLVLLAAAEQIQGVVSPETVCKWGNDLGLDFSQYKKLIAEVLNSKGCGPAPPLSSQIAV